eukprot:m51a1_g3302 hypothetical protein (82) ;mRNA; r:313873-314118
MGASEFHHLVQTLRPEVCVCKALGVSVILEVHVVAALGPTRRLVIIGDHEQLCPAMSVMGSRGHTASTSRCSGVSSAASST